VDENDVVDRVDDADDAGATSMGHFGFLQTAYYQAGAGNYIGSLTVDDLRVGRTFSDVRPLARFTSITNGLNGVIGMRAVGQPTTNYLLQASTNLLSTNWVNLGVTAAGDNGFLDFTDQGATNYPNRFYRLVEQ
jgi:hypothetical protein